LVLPTRPGTTQIVQPTVAPGQVIVPSATIWYPYLRLTEESFYLTRTAVGLPTVVPEGTP
jgi:hypothetical protein